MSIEDDLDELNQRELTYWLAFDNFGGTGIGPKRVINLFERFRSLEEVWGADETDLITIGGLSREASQKLISRRKEIDPLARLETLQKLDIRAIAYADPRYPSQLRQIYEPPLVLYVCGTFEEQMLSHAVGIVGTRRPSAYGTRSAGDLARELALAGVTIISGMAAGIDTTAHWGALKTHNGKTVAIAGCGPDICYPNSNRELYNCIIEEGRGAVISEYFPGTPPDKFRFPARNRIIAGLSKAVVVVEARKVSGSLITANLAFEQNREVFAIPGRIDMETAYGTNNLIAVNKARLLCSAQDLLQEMGWATANGGRIIPTIVELWGKEKDVYELLSSEPIHFEVLIDKTGMSAAELAATLTILELSGVVIKLPGDWYALPSSRQHSSPRLPGT